MKTGAPLMPRRPFRGAWLGFGCGLVLLLVARADPQNQLSDGTLAGVYLIGGIMAGVIGGVLWPYQRSRVETLVFAIPTAVPPYVLAGHAVGISVLASVLIAICTGGLYALFHGGQHQAADKTSSALDAENAPTGEPR